MVVREKEIRRRKARLSRFGLIFVRVIAIVLFVLCVERSVTKIALRWTKTCDHPLERLNVNVDGNRHLFLVLVVCVKCWH